jgi:transposase-like protein
MRKCKFLKDVICAKKKMDCIECDVRNKIGQQTIIPEKPTKIKETSTATIEVTNKEFLCPFCLFKGNISKFYIYTKKGISEKRFKCPDCGEYMLRETLTGEKTIEEFAEWFLENLTFNKKRIK